MNTTKIAGRKTRQYLPSITAGAVLRAHQHSSLNVPLSSFGRGHVRTGETVVLFHEHSIVWPEGQIRAFRLDEGRTAAWVLREARQAGFQWGFNDPEANGEFTFTSLGLYTVTEISPDVDARRFTATLERTDPSTVNHYVNKALIARSIVDGVAVQAACGERFVVVEAQGDGRTDAADAVDCPLCEFLYSQMKAE